MSSRDSFRIVPAPRTAGKAPPVSQTKVITPLLPLFTADLRAPPPQHHCPSPANHGHDHGGTGKQTVRNLFLAPHPHNSVPARPSSLISLLLLLLFSLPAPARAQPFYFGDKFTGYSVQTQATVACDSTTKGNIRYNDTTVTFEGCNGTSWSSAIGSGGASLNGITAATASQAGIANANNTIVWNWDALTNGSAMKFGTNSTTATNGQKVFEIASTGANATAGATTYGAYITNTHSTNTSTNVGLYASASGGATANYAALFPAGNVGIGTATPAQKLAVAYDSSVAVDPIRIYDTNAVHPNHIFSITSGNHLVYGDDESGSGPVNSVNFGNGAGGTFSGGWNFFLINPGTVASDSYIFRVQNGGSDKFLVSGSGNVGIGTASPTAFLHVSPAAAASGTAIIERLTGAANTGQTLSTEVPDVDWALARTVTWATGALATQRAVKIAAPTYAFAGASTLTDAATVGITGAPVKGTNTTLTNTHALLISAGAVSTAANSYGLTVNAQTGATNNYAAQFMGGNVGIGTTAPAEKLHVGAGNIAIDYGYAFKSANSVGSIKPILGAEATNQTYVRALDNAGSAGVRIEQYDGTAIAFFQQGGSVGIGTATPSGALNIVNGNANWSLYLNGNMAAASGMAASLHSNNGILAAANNDHLYGIWADNAFDGNGKTGVSAYQIYARAPVSTNTANNYTLYLEAPSGGTVSNIGLYNAGTSYFGGNVGIGTTSPGATLEVNGNIKLSGASPTYKITNVLDPTASSDVATKAYVDAHASSTPTWHVTTFTSSATWTLPSGVYAINALVVGAGGGGGGGDNVGSGSGGGGGGGISYSTNLAVTANLTVTVGAAGTAGALNTSGGAGGASYISQGGPNLLYAWGGSGGLTVPNGGSGGSGGGGINTNGGGNCTNGTAAAGLVPGLDGTSGGGGGGGCSGGGAGGNGGKLTTMMFGPVNGGNGGASWGGGGGGASYGTAGTGGTAALPGTAGTNGGGGGGGGVNTAGGAGGSGYVIIWALY